ncbi:MAG: class II glutamine amidotransferase, partial [Pseudomonadota bacterium]
AIMCRLVAYQGEALALETLIVTPSHSLVEQSQHASEAKFAVQGDGFGIAWYDGAGQGPGVYRDVLPAWSDGNLPSLCRMIRSPLFMAHVRASTTGETTRQNCHPFSHGRWSFIHNGQIPDIVRIRRPLEALLCDELYEAKRGNTDSELMFLLLLQYGLETDVPQAIRKVLGLVRQHSCWGRGWDACRFACVLSDGERLMAFRASSDGRAPTLYRRVGEVVLASEPLDGQENGWLALPENRLLVAQDGVVMEMDLEEKEEMRLAG